jgi:hypothetical protein
VLVESLRHEYNHRTSDSNLGLWPLWAFAIVVGDSLG